MKTYKVIYLNFQKQEKELELKAHSIEDLKHYCCCFYNVHSFISITVMMEYMNGK